MMKILHYSLGFSPYRSGGMTNYVMDILQEQSKSENVVALLWPGRMYNSKFPYIISHGYNNKIQSFELVNPLPIVLDQPIKNPDIFHSDVHAFFLKKFLDKYKPNIIHVHTLQGISYEFLKICKDLNIPLIFTTHDFFGLYPMNQIYPMDHSLTDDESTLINSSGPSIFKIILLQSRIVRLAKENRLIRNFFKKYSKKKAKKVIENIDNRDIQSYSELRKYIIKILKLFDYILFNSTVSKYAYERYITPVHSEILYITTKTIRKNTFHKSSFHKPLRLAYCGGEREYKGYKILTQALNSTCNDDIVCYMYGVEGIDTKHIKYMPAYSNFLNIVNNIDCVIVPSQSYESFGLVAIEAISNNIPVIVSDCVGAKDIFNVYGDKYIFKSQSFQDLKKLLDNLSQDSFIDFEKCISYIYPRDINEHVIQLSTIYEKVIKQCALYQ